MSKWPEVIVGDIVDARKNALVGGPFGSNLVSKDYVKEGVPVIRGQNMGSRQIGGEFVFVTEKKAQALSANTARPGDLVFTQRGTLGQVALVPHGLYDTYIVSQSQMKLTADPKKADPLFLYYIFSSPQQLAYIDAHAIKVGVPHTNLGILRNTPVILPPLAEQHRIVEILGTLDDKIELNRQLNATLEQLASTLFRSWFVDFDPVRAKASGEPTESICSRLGLTPELLALFPTTFESSAMGNIPAGWKIASIGEVVDVVGGGTPSTAIEEYWHKGTYHWATPKDLSGLNSPMLLDTDRKITEKGVRNISSGLLPRDTVLLSSRAPVGYLAISAVPIAINQGFIAMRCNGPITPYYAYMWCLDNMGAIKSRASGTTFLEISKKSFRPMQVLIPSKQIMLEFTALAELLFNQIEEGAKEAVTLANLRDELLPKLLSGQIKLS